jgi:hypothetical protein
MHLGDSSRPWDLGAGGIVFASSLRRASVALGISPEASAKDLTLPGDSQTILVATELESKQWLRRKGPSGLP